MVAYFCPLHIYARQIFKIRGKYVNMLLPYVNLQHIYVDMQHNYVDMRDDYVLNITYFACRGQKLATLSYTYFDIPQDTYLFLEWCDIRTHDENERELDKLPDRNKDHFRVSTVVNDSQKRFELEKSVIFWSGDVYSQNHGFNPISLPSAKLDKSRSIIHYV